MIKLYYFIYFFIAIIVTNVYCQNAGDSCVVNGQPGICTAIQSCPAAIAILATGRRPTLCSSRGTRSLACCPSNQTPRTTTTESSTQRCDPINNLTARKTGRKAWDKCIEIAEAIYPCEVEGYTLIPTYFREDRCSHDSVTLIVGGSRADVNEFPHMALLGYGDAPDVKWDCGGSLISERWVMTAGHCIRNRDGPVKYIRLGSPNRSDPNLLDSDFLYTVARTVPHPRYNGSSHYNDIALLQTDRIVEFGYAVIPACIHVGNPVDDLNFLASGWGATERYGDGNDILLKVKLNKFSQSECSAKNPKDRRLRNGIIEATQLCAGHRTLFKDTCQGDSGGPLQIFNYEVPCTYIVMGITSFGRGCGTPGYPGVYTRVSAFVPWIESVVWP